MPPAARKRKTIAIGKGHSIAPSSQQCIQAFGKISKSQVQVSGKGSLKSVSEDANGNSIPKADIGKKRKLQEVEDVYQEHEPQNAGVTPKEATTVDGGNREAKLSPGQAHPLVCFAVPKTSPKKTVAGKFDAETPTKVARKLLEDLALPSLPPSTRTSSAIAKIYETPPSSPVSAETTSASPHYAKGLPDELHDLINLHSCFLTALSLYYAHNGAFTPADLRALGPDVEKAWRKRRVAIDDIQRILALQSRKNATGEEKAGPLYLSNYGHGKICVEIADIDHSSNTQRRPVDEEALNATFIENIEQQWLLYRSAQPSNPCAPTFITSLPLLPITPCASLSKIGPLLSKGQRRLEDLKAGAIRAQQAPLKAADGNIVSAPQQKRKQTVARSSNLFSRLKAKQLHQSTLPLPPSSESLSRTSALQRLPEIAPIMESLAVSSKKHCDDDADAEAVKLRIAHVSFTLPTLVQHLQMSLRNPIGKEEATRCVRLLAEVVPEWVRTREVGKMVGVTIRGSGVGRDELTRRIGVLAN